jgi:hypothetical protein
MRPDKVWFNKKEYVTVEESALFWRVYEACAADVENLVWIPKNQASVEPPVCRKSARTIWKESGDYWDFDNHKEFFQSHNFTTSLEENPQECWWLIGYIQSCGQFEYHESVREKNLVVQRRGPTRHVYFPDPHKKGLDTMVGEFFDFYRAGYVQINSVDLERCFDSLPPVPPGCNLSYQDGLKAGQETSR